MPRSATQFALSAAIALFTLAALAASAQAQVKVLFWGGTATGTHNSQALRDTLTRLFSTTNVTMAYREANTHAWLAADTLNQYDVVLLYTTNPGASGGGQNLTTPQEDALINWVASGRVIVALHGSTNCYRDNPRWRALLGAQFVDHSNPNNSGTSTFQQPLHSSLTGTTPMPASAAGDPGGTTNPTVYWDEGRQHNMYVSDTVVIARAQLGTGSVPWIWVRPQGKGFVYYNASGHNFRTWQRPEWKGQLIRALYWGKEIKTAGIHGQAGIRSLFRTQGSELLVPLQGGYRLEITDMQGRRVFFRGRSSASAHDLGFLPAGTYGVDVLSETRESLRGLFIKPR